MKKMPVICFAAFLAALSSCSTTRCLQEGEYRLAKNKIVVTNDSKFNTNQLDNYLKQKSNNYLIFGWNPFLNLYNTGSGKGDFWDRFAKKVGDAPVVFEEDLVLSSEKNIRNHLDYLGYYNSKVTADIHKVRKLVKVTYNVQLGDRYVIDTLEINTPGGEFAETFKLDSAGTSIHKGDFLSASSLENESIRSSKFMRDHGFYGFDKNYYVFDADTVSKPGHALLSMEILNYPRSDKKKHSIEHKKYYLGNVEISFPADIAFREKLLSKINTIEPTALYSENDINLTYSRLSSMRVFNSVNVVMTPRAGVDTVDCHINMTKSKLQGFKAELEASTNSNGLFGISPQLSYYHKNIFGGGEWLNLSFLGNFQFKFNDRNTKSNEFGFSSTLSLPSTILLAKQNSVPRSEIKLAYNYQDRPEYTRTIIATSYGYSATEDRFYYQVTPVQLNIVKLFNVDKAFQKSLEKDPFMKDAYQDHFDLGFGQRYVYTTDSSPNPKTSFFKATLQADLAGNVLSLFKGLMPKDSLGNALLWKTPFSQYVRGEGSIAKTWRFGKNDKQAFATRFLIGAGYAYGNSSALPFEKHFYAGGSSSMRGWQARTLGPGLSPTDTTFVLPSQTGDFKLEANMEYRFGLFWKLDGALFLDVGNIWNLRGNDDISRLSSATFLKGLAADWGAGIRLDLNFLVLRIDSGFKIHDPSRGDKAWLKPQEWFDSNGYAVHFGVGYPF